MLIFISYLYLVNSWQLRQVFVIIYFYTNSIEFDRFHDINAFSVFDAYPNIQSALKALHGLSMFTNKSPEADLGLLQHLIWSFL